jgi:hypothetical protein
MPVIGSLNYASTLDLRGVLPCINFLQLLLPTLLYHFPLPYHFRNRLSCLFRGRLWVTMARRMRSLATAPSRASAGVYDLLCW